MPSFSPMHQPQHSVLSQISQLVGGLDANQMRTYQVLGEQLGHRGRMVPEFFRSDAKGFIGRWSVWKSKRS